MEAVRDSLVLGKILVFIDSSHELSDTRNEIAAALMLNADFIAFHDTELKSVSGPIKEFSLKVLYTNPYDHGFVVAKKGV